jgi:hypothetical protein
MPRTPRRSKIPSPSPIRIPYPHTRAESAKCYSLTVPGSNLSAFARAKAMSTRSLRISRIPTSILSTCLRNWLAGLHNGRGTHSDVLALSLTPDSDIRCQIAPNRYSSNTAIFERIAQCRVGLLSTFSAGPSSPNLLRSHQLAAPCIRGSFRRSSTIMDSYLIFFRVH